jgi:hypothetical protein
MSRRSSKQRRASRRRSRLVAFHRFANARGYVVLPDGYSFEWVKPSKTGFDVPRIIERIERRLAEQLAPAFTVVFDAPGGTVGSLREIQRTVVRR